MRPNNTDEAILSKHPSLHLVPSKLPAALIIHLLSTSRETNSCSKPRSRTLIRVKFMARSKGTQYGRVQEQRKGIDMTGGTGKPETQGPRT